MKPFFTGVLWIIGAIICIAASAGMTAGFWFADREYIHLLDDCVYVHNFTIGGAVIPTYVVSAFLVVSSVLAILAVTMAVNMRMTRSYFQMHSHWLFAICAFIAIGVVVWLTFVGWASRVVAEALLNEGFVQIAPISDANGTEPGRVRDMDARTRLLERIGDINNFDLPRPLVSLEEFFEGNDDRGSIGYNLPDPVAPHEFYQIFRSIRDRDDVADVLIEVKDIEDPDGWPSTDTIWVITSMSREQLDALIPEKIKPDDWLRYPPAVISMEPISVPAGMQAFGIWYD